MSGLGAGQGATREHPHPDGADPVACRRIEELAEVVRGIAGRHHLTGRGHQQVVEDLRAVEASRRGERVQIVGLALGGEPEQARLARLPELLERGDDLLEHLRSAELAARVPTADGVVQLEEVDVIELEPGQAGLKRALHRARYIRHVRFGQAHLGADDEAIRVAAERPAEIRLGCAVAVARRRVEEADAVVTRRRGPGRPARRSSSARRQRRSRTSVPRPRGRYGRRPLFAWHPSSASWCGRISSRSRSSRESAARESCSSAVRMPLGPTAERNVAIPRLVDRRHTAARLRPAVVPAIGIA